MNEKVFHIADFVVQKIIQLRGETQNRIAFLVAFAGVTLAAEPVWQPYLAAYILKRFGLPVEWESAQLVGCLLILGAMFYHFLALKLRRGQLAFESEEVTQHDAALYSTLVAEHSVDILRDSIDWITTDDSYTDSQLEQIDHWRRFLARSENNFLGNTLQEAAVRLQGSIDRFHLFLASHFFVYPDSPGAIREDSQNCLYPDHNIERGARRADAEGQLFYARKATELNQLAGLLLDDLDAFVRSAKRSLGHRALPQAR